MQLSGVILSQPCNCSLCFGGIIKSPAWLEQGDFNAFGGDGGMGDKVTGNGMRRCQMT